VIALIPIPKAKGEVTSIFGFSEPWFVILSDDDRQAFISNRGGGSVSIVDAKIDRETTSIDVGEQPLGMTYLDGELFVANNWSNTITVIDTLGGIARENIEISGMPAYLARHDGKLYITLQHKATGNLVAVMDAIGGHIEERIAVDQFPQGVAVDPLGRYLYVTNHDSNSLSWVDLGRGSSLLITVGPNPQGVAVSPSGDYVYTADATRVTRINAQKQIVENEFTVPGARFGWLVVVQLPDGMGDLVYATDTAGDRLWEWHPDSGESASVDVGVAPFGVAATKDGKTIFVCSSGSDQVQRLDVW
jgi:YVTN family beta-propeller protein